MIMNNKVEELMRKYHYGFKHSNDLLEDEYVKDLNKEIERLNNIIGAIEEDIEVERMSTWAPGPLYLTELMEKIKKLKEGKK